jgi:hypothetical protein
VEVMIIQVRVEEDQWRGQPPPEGKARTMATAANDTDFGFERVTGLIGAWVQNFRPDTAVNQANAPALRRALSEYGVLFFDFGRIPDVEEYTRFASLFGNVQAAFGQQLKDRERMRFR